MVRPGTSPTSWYRTGATLPHRAPRRGETATQDSYGRAAGCQCSRLSALIVTVAVGLAGCARSTGNLDAAQSPRPSDRAYIVADQAGARFTCMARLNDRTLVQAADCAIHVIDIPTARTVGTLDIGTPGVDGIIVDLAIGRAAATGNRSAIATNDAIPARDDCIWAVLDRSAVVVIDVRDRAQPAMIERRDADTLGMTPKYASAIDGRIFISGDGGVVEWATGQRWRDDAEVAFGRVVMTMHGPAVNVQRQIRTLRHDQFLGAADVLHAVPRPPASPADPSEANAPGETTPGQTLVGRALPMRWLGLLRISDGCELALMGSDLRAISRRITPLHVTTLAVHPDGRSAAAATDHGIVPIRIRDDTIDIDHDQRIPLRGVHDVVHLGNDRIAACGDFGLAIITDDGSVTLIARGFGPFDNALFDGRNVTAWPDARSAALLQGGSAIDTWTFATSADTVHEIQTNQREIPPSTPPRQRAAMLDVRATIDDTGQALAVAHRDGVSTFASPDESTMYTVVACDGCWWVGHDRGIWIVDALANAPRLMQSITLGGPVRHIFVMPDNQSVLAVGRNTVTLIRSAD